MKRISLGWADSPYRYHTFGCPRAAEPLTGLNPWPYASACGGATRDAQLFFRMNEMVRWQRCSA